MKFKAVAGEPVEKSEREEEILIGSAYFHRRLSIIVVKQPALPPSVSVVTLKQFEDLPIHASTVLIGTLILFSSLTLDPCRLSLS